MKTIPKLLVPVLLMLAVVGIVTTGPKATAQTAAEVLAAFNAGVCDAFSLADGCTDAQVLTAYCTTQPQPCVDNRTAEQKIYSTVNAFANAVLLPPRQKAIFAQRRDIILARLMRIVTTDPVRCAAVLSAAGIADQTVCK